MAKKELSDKGPDGSSFGQSATDLIGFHGAAPSDQYALVTLVSGTLGDANAAILSILACLKEKGFIASA